MNVFKKKFLNVLEEAPVETLDDPAGIEAAESEALADTLEP